MARYQTTSDTNPDSPWCWNIDLSTDLGHVFGTCFLRRPAPWNSLRHRNCPLADDQKQWGNHCGKNNIVDKYIPTCVCIYISTCVNVYVYIYICVCVCACMFIYSSAFTNALNCFDLFTICIAPPNPPKWKSKIVSKYIQIMITGVPIFSGGTIHIHGRSVCIYASE